MFERKTLEALIFDHFAQDAILVIVFNEGREEEFVDPDNRNTIWFDGIMSFDKIIRKI
jgi:hypothetical protein